jgi:hypothetical protein
MVISKAYVAFFYEGKYANKKGGIVNCDATLVLPAASFK